MMASTTCSRTSVDEKEATLGIVSAACYFFFVLFIGVPVWWKTTEVYRVSLPYSDIDNLSSLVSVKTKVNIQVVSSLDVSSDNYDISKALQKATQGSNIYDFLLSTRTHTKDEVNLLKSVENVGNLDERLQALYSNIPAGTIIVFDVSDKASLIEGNQVVIGHYRTIYLTSKVDIEVLTSVLREVLLGETAVQKTLDIIEDPYHNKPDTSGSRRATASKGYDMLFSLIVPQPERLLVSWDIEDSIEESVEPFLNTLGTNFSAISTKSQIMYLTKLKLTARKDKTQNFFEVDPKELGLAINPVESQMASHVSSLPRFNFITYIPPLDQTPLYISTNGEKLPSNAFLLPRWGGVSIQNIPEVVEKLQTSRDVDPMEVKINTRKVMLTFMSQLRQLLGIQEESSFEVLKNKAATILPFSDPSKPYLRLWERDFLYRLRTVENLELTKVTLQALAHLLTQISNIVINDEIGNEVQSAVESSREAVEHIHLGRLDEAFHASKRSFLASDKAFFDPSLLALLYFPEDQKYAVYIPLFLPVGIPVILSIKSIKDFVKSRSKAKSD